MVEYQPNDMLNTTDSDILDKSKIKLDHEEIKIQVVKVLANEDSKTPITVIGNLTKRKPNCTLPYQILLPHFHI